MAESSLPVPAVSVVIPTYNSADLLRVTLDSLCEQSVPRDMFEVVVADDGSADDTAVVCDHYRAVLRLKYHFQPDLGFRPATARNAGAQLAESDLLCFLDTGVIAGPGLIAAHRAAHQAAAGLAVVIGYVYGYSPFDPWPGLADLLRSHTAEQAVAYLQRHQVGRDMRHRGYTEVDFNLDRLRAPWVFFFGVNVSVGASAFRAVGGFDEEFNSWGVEDIELGYRLSASGVPIRLDLDAWAIETPVERQPDDNTRSHAVNVDRFLRKHRAPEVELFQHSTPSTLNKLLDELYDHRGPVPDLEVCGELAGIAAECPVIFGACRIPPGWPPTVVVDFEDDALRQVIASGPHTAVHAVGLQTGLPAKSADLAIITSRMARLWPRWGDRIAAEAARIAHRVHYVFDAGKPAQE